MNRIDRRTGVYALIASSFLLVAVTTAVWANPAGGYEMSIYQAYPVVFWISIGMAFFASQVIVVRSMLLQRGGRSWTLGFAITFVAVAILLALPTLRGYAVYGRGDVLSHIGMIKDTLRNGAINGDIYPMDHILVAAIASLSNLSLVGSLNLIQPDFYLVYAISMFLLLRRTYGSNRSVLFAFAIAAIPLFSYKSVAYAPFIQAFSLSPFIIYLYTRHRGEGRRAEFGIATITMALLIVLFHPLVALSLILIFALYELSIGSVPYADPRGRKTVYGNRFTVIAITSIFFVTWQSALHGLVSSLGVLIGMSPGEAGESQFELYGGTVDLIKPQFYDSLSILILKFGQLVLLAFAALILIGITEFRRNRAKSRTIVGRSNPFLALGFLSFSLIATTLFFRYYVVEFDRLFIYSALFSVLILPQGVAIATSYVKDADQRRRRRHLVPIALGSFALLMLLLSTVNLFPSPLTANINQDVSRQELSGMEFFFPHRDDNLVILEWGIEHERFYDAIYGIDPDRRGISYGAQLTAPIAHFGYEQNESLGPLYDDTRYFLLTTLGRLYFQELFPNQEASWRFDFSDFQRLDGDPAVNAIFSNGDLDVFVTHPTRIT